ncbi:2'-5' RNA ligase family protein [Clostridium sp. YIM B02505]|uniref:2'-5' RNA ligase family protein n=1 Tax=Clostridium yunnanense TaxID=2800325 RepID=A0ABS1ERX0_9CLOT|nr:2'-5' RNA ligase family protein [Clostridium yunnanense]MBK1812075.1 2'-5' RNA ligase family protein [Clostridium yunnanense]
MRYVIVSVIKGKAGDFNNNLRKEVFNKFKAKSSKLPAHFTIKAPFEYEGSIKELEYQLSTLCEQSKVTPLTIDGFDHFDNRVVYMSMKLTNEGKEIHDKVIDVLQSFNFINFKENEGKEKAFHITVASKNIKPIYQYIWDYVSEISCKFESSFDNVSIYKWENNTWVLHKEFIFKG